MPPDIEPSLLSRVRELMKHPNFKRNDGKQKIPLDDFVMQLFQCGGSAYALAKKIGVSHSMVAERRRNVESALNVELPRGRAELWKGQAHRTRLGITLINGTMLVGSDLHCWPELYGAAMAAFVDLNRRLKPDYVILNGDGFDGATNSSHPRLGWDKRPSVQEELEALQEYLDQVRKANPNAKYRRTRGNHDSRFDTYLSSNAPLVEGVKGTTLSDHLPGWDECMSIDVNSNCVIKHRHRSGVHVAWTNVRDYGCHIVTGHTHRQLARPWSNKMGTWYGVDLGMMAPVDGPQFDYMEHSPTDWRSGFAVLTFRDGKLMPPDLATVTDEDRGEVYFRGQTLTYDL